MASKIEKCIIVNSPGGIGIMAHPNSEVEIIGNYITSAPRWYQVRRWWNLIRLIATGIE